MEVFTSEDSLYSLEDPHTQILVSWIMTCSKSSDTQITFKHTRTTTGEDRPPQKAKLHMRTKQTWRRARPDEDYGRLHKRKHEGRTGVTWMSWLGFWPQFAVSRFGCRLAALISFCLRLKSIQTFRPSSNRRYPTVSAKSSFGLRPAGKCKPPLPHFPPPSHHHPLSLHLLFLLL